MTQTTWTNEQKQLEKPRRNNLKFIIGGVLILAALGFLIFNALSDTQQFYVTVGEYSANPTKYQTRDLRLTAFVLGDSIQFTQIDDFTSRLEFDIADDVNNPTQTVHVVAMNEPVPDLLQHEAQAVVEGSIGADGSMYANPGGLLLKCPTRYEEGESAAAAAVE
jgi:cytochrome c-type biogenesis protein CcmE